MSDIYKTNEPIRSVQKPPSRRRRRSSNRVFDDTGERKRRSSNSGLRRLWHVIRKKENEGKFWWTAGIATLVLLVGVFVWQFLVMESIARQRSREMEQETAVPAEAEQEPVLVPLGTE